MLLFCDPGVLAFSCAEIHSLFAQVVSNIQIGLATAEYNMIRLPAIYLA